MRSLAPRRRARRRAPSCCARACSATTPSPAHGRRGWATRPRRRCWRSPSASGLDAAAERAAAPAARGDPVRRRAPLHGDAAPPPRRRRRSSTPRARRRRCCPAAAMRRRARSSSRGRPAGRAAVQRVLLFAAREDVDARGPRAASSTTCACSGLQAMIDPPRPEALEAVAACRRAGVRVLMITGDHPRTARAIGAALGPSRTPGRDRRRARRTSTTPAARSEPATTDVYARVAPEHKLRLVRALRRRGRGRRHDRRRRQRRAGAAPGRHRRGDGPRRHGGGQGGRRHGARRRQLRDAARGGRGGPAGLRQPRQGAELRAADEPRPGAHHRRRGPRLPSAATASRCCPSQPVQILWINLIVAVALALPLALEAAEPDSWSAPRGTRGARCSTARCSCGRSLVSVTLTAVALGALRPRARPPARRGRDRRARARPGADDGRHRRGAAAGALPAHLPLADPPQPRAGWWSNPSVYAGIALGARAPGAVRRRSRSCTTCSAPPTIDARALASAAAGALLVLPVTSLEERWRGRERTQRGRPRAETLLDPPRLSRVREPITGNPQVERALARTKATPRSR